MYSKAYNFPSPATQWEFVGGGGKGGERAQASLGAQTAKNPPAIAGDAGSIPGGEDPLEKEVATHSSIPAWRIPWTEEPGGLQSMGSQRVGQD